MTDLRFELPSYKHQPERGATVLPSGIVRAFPLAAIFDDQVQELREGREITPAQIDRPEGEFEEQRASLLADFVRVSPAFARVLVRETQPRSAPVPKHILPPVSRLVFVPIL